MTGPLKLRAEDEEDLAVVSAVLQDALVPIGEMAFLPEEKRFVLVANRFKWEGEPLQGGKLFERTHTGIAFDEVAAVKTRGFDRKEADRILQVLAVRAEPGAVLFDFSGSDSMRLEVGRILCHLEDLGEPWPTPWRPRHPLEEG
jgi:Protein of unknown function (DUF2948)